VAVVTAGSRNTHYRAACYGLLGPVFHRLDRASNTGAFRSSDAPRGLLDPAVVTALDPKPTWAMQTKGSLASKLVSQKCADLIDRGLGSSFVIFYPVAEVPFPRLEPIIVE